MKFSRVDVCAFAVTLLGRLGTLIFIEGGGVLDEMYDDEVGYFIYQAMAESINSARSLFLKHLQFYSLD